MVKTNQLRNGTKQLLYISPLCELIVVKSEGIICQSEPTEDVGETEGEW